MRRYLGIIVLALLCGCTRLNTVDSDRPSGPVVTGKVQETVESTASPQAETVELSGDKVDPPALQVGQLEVHAEWEQAQGTDMQELLRSESRGEALRGLQTAEPDHTYQTTQLAGLFPSQPTAVGEVYEVDSSVAQNLLSQFHQEALTDLNMDSQGCYGTLAAHSEQYLKYYLRLHAQFEIADGVYYTPAEFSGPVVVDRESGQIVYLQLAVPTTRAKNLGFEMHVGEHMVGLDFIPQMELSAGDDAKFADLAWQESIPLEQAASILARKFYTFEQIDWVPPAQAISRAQKEKKPIFAVVIEGVLDDQSC